MSTSSSPGSRSQRPAEAYFQPPSANSSTTCWSRLHRGRHPAAPPATTAPAETPAQMPLAVEQRPQADDGLGVRDQQLAVELGDVEDLRGVAVLERAQAHHGVALQRLGGDDLHVRVRLAQRAGRCPSACRRCRGRPRTRRPRPPSLEDLGAGRAVVRVGVGRVAYWNGMYTPGIGRGQLARQRARRRSSPARRATRRSRRRTSAAAAPARAWPTPASRPAAGSRARGRPSPARCRCCRSWARARSGPGDSAPVGLGRVDHRAARRGP